MSFDFAVNDSSHLIPLGHDPTHGEWPRNFALNPAGSHLFVENLHSEEIVAFDVDSETGTLDPTKSVMAVASPMCMVFATLDND